MPAAPTPLLESERLEALRAWDILDTEPEEAFDDIVRLASGIFDAPVGLVSLVDDSRQWFKARVGMGRAETRREDAVCAHAILEPGRTLVSRDLMKDDRFRDNPMLRNEQLRFYAGAPLVDREGNALGTVCVMDHRPTDDAEDLQSKVEMLEALSRQTMRMIELRAASRRMASLLKQVHVLEELVPVCAWCKRIRDDVDYWGTLEQYLEARGLELTHGICPDCLTGLESESASTD